MGYRHELADEQWDTAKFIWSWTV